MRSKVVHYYRNISKYGRAAYEKFARKLKRKSALLIALEEESIAISKNLRKFLAHCNDKLKMSANIPALMHGGNEVELDSVKTNPFGDYFEMFTKA